jgi:hypothetical protein
MGLDDTVGPGIFVISLVDDFLSRPHFNIYTFICKQLWNFFK